MADLKISQLTGATTPLVGTEVLPIVQSGSTVKVSIANLTAGRAVASAGGTFSDNFVQGTAAKGVNFTANTPAAGMTSQLLNWYEEGTFTPTFTNLTVVGTPTYAGTYTRIGRMVYCRVVVTSTTSTASTNGSTYFSDLPFTPNGLAICVAADGATAAGYGTGILAPPNVYTPTWGASSSVTIALTYTT